MILDARVKAGWINEADSWQQSRGEAEEEAAAEEEAGEAPAAATQARDAA